MPQAPKVPETKAGLNAPDKSADSLPGPQPAPNPNVDALLMPDEPPPPYDTVIARAAATLTNATKQYRELTGGPIGAKAPVLNPAPGGYSPYMVGGYA